jgi:hypothetical protein
MDKASKAMTPESQKSTGDKAKDKTSGTLDNAAGSLQPDSTKSESQKAGDKGSGMLEQAKDAASNAFSSESELKQKARRVKG